MWGAEENLVEITSVTVDRMLSAGIDWKLTAWAFLWKFVDPVGVGDQMAACTVGAYDVTLFFPM